MEKKNLTLGDHAIRHLEIAALYPQRRGEMITRALQELLVCLPAVGTALVWPRWDRNVPWKVYYTGIRPESIRRWLAVRLDFSLEATLGVLQQDLSKLSDMPFPHLVCLQPAPMFSAGLWIIWPGISPLPSAANDCLEEVRRTLEALIEVESSEEYYFSSASPLSDQILIEALAQGDPHALLEFLSLTRLVGKGEIATWGRAYEDVIEATDHIGARQSGYGFIIPRGKGVHGRIITSGDQPVVIEDYRNSQYRDPSVSDIVDGEQIRSVFALPVHTRIGQERSEHIAGILYLARRSVKPVSLTEQLLMSRMTHLLEPLRPLTRPPSFLSSSLSSVPNQKAAWYKLILHANRIENLEIWMEQFTKGTVIVTDSDGRPYVSARNEQLKHLRASLDHSMDGVQVIRLEAPGVSLPSQVYLRSAIALPPTLWPDFYADLVVGCNLIIRRMEEARDHLARQREQWLHTVLQEKPLPHTSQEGYRLGLPIEEGQVWVIAWPTERPLTRQAARQRMLAENTVLDQLKSPLLFFGDDIGVVLLDKDVQGEPSQLRNALLTQFVPHPLWIVYGARYHSLRDLKMVLTHSTSQAQKARREGNSEYLLDTQTSGLESLLTNPRLTEDQSAFATRLLTPLLEYDKSKGTDLTTTFVLAQTLGSTQAVSEKLGMHISTIRYRLRRAEDILGIEEASPKDRVAWGLASFIWISSHPLEETTS